MTRLLLAEDCLVVPGENVLHVVNRRGTREIRGRDVHHLHQRIAPYLRGAYGEEELLAAVPASQAGPLRAYLDGLRSTGALVDEREGEEREAEEALERMAAELGAARPRLRLRTGNGRVAVSLDGPASAREGVGAHRICFVSPAEAGGMLLRVTGPNLPPGRTTCVIVASSGIGAPPPAELERRAAYAQWLLHAGARGPFERERLAIFTLEAQGTFRRIACVNDATELFGQLEIVECAEVDQLPLCVAHVAHPLFSIRDAAYGLTFSDVRNRLLRDFVARSRLDFDHNGRRGELTAPWGTWSRALFPDEASAQATVAGSLLELRLALAERFAEEHAGDAPARWQEINLLEQDGEHPAVAYLVGVLRLRMSVLPARIARTAHGLFIGEAGSHRSTSLLRRKVVATLLLRMVWERFYREMAGPVTPSPACGHHDLASPAELRQLLGAASRSLLRDRTSLPMVARRFRLWGMEAWAGALDPRICGRVKP